MCSWSPTWPLWRHEQISNASHLNMSNAIFLIFFQWPKLNNSQHCGSNNVGIRGVRLHVAKSLTTFKANKKTGHFLSVENTKPIHLKIGLLTSQKNYLRQAKNSNSDHLIYIYLQWFLLFFLYINEWSRPVFCSCPTNWLNESPTILTSVHFALKIINAYRVVSRCS